MKQLMLILSLLASNIASAGTESPTSQRKFQAWAIDDRVSSQVGLYFGRDGSGRKESPEHARWLNELSLPSGALVGNGISLPGALETDLAQIDFFELSPQLMRLIRLPQVYHQQLSYFSLPKQMKAKVIATVGGTLLVKDVRLRSPDTPTLKPSLSQLSSSPVTFPNAIAYVTVFIRDANRRDGVTALEAFKKEVSVGRRNYQIGEIISLPAIPHPEDSTIRLVSLMTLRLILPDSKKQLALEVIEVM